MKGRARIILISTGLGLVLLLVLPHMLPMLAGLISPKTVFAIETREKRIYLTIDDGPSRHTGDILAVLAKHRVHATFFITGDHVASVGQLNQIRALGHAIGHHMGSTRAASSLTIEEFQGDFDKTAALLERSGPTLLFRPSSGFGTAAQREHARKRGYIPVIGTAFPLDHWITHPGILSRLAQWLCIRGGIIILHDTDQRGRATALVLDRLIPRLKKAGYRFGDLEIDAQQQLHRGR